MVNFLTRKKFSLSKEINNPSLFKKALLNTLLQGTKKGFKD